MQPKALFIGRWQPWHKGHEWLINQKLKENTPVLIAIRDVLPDKYNPFTVEQTKLMIETLYQEKDVQVIIIPDIESVNYGRGVGYAINEFIPPSDIVSISATEIRNAIKNNNNTWKSKVNQKLHKLIEYFFKSFEDYII